MSNNLKTAYNFNNLNELMDRIGLSGKYIDFKYLKGFVDTKISMFTYDNLPKDLTSEILETALCFNNRLCFYKSSVFGVCLCRYLPLGDYNLYWKPTKVDLLALNGKSIATNVDYNDIVLVKDNTMDIIPFLWIVEYIEKINMTEITLEKLLKVLRLPAIFTGSKETVTSFKQVIKKALDIDAFTVGDKTLIESFKQFDINLPCELEDILAIYKNFKNMALESIGIYGTESQKRERLLVGEVQSQTEYVDFIYQSFLKCRKNFVNECNAKFGTNIVLNESYKEFREDEIEMQKESEMIDKSNGGMLENGN